ncbi:uncharacterized protein BYT42DRAFT_585707 [Radiomyces spectabilis]|uniref:uncharacterized protein n=1 Tax=Radiomyces spectabilis TaxID=64574 RepID=UPI0022200B2B|nr:uncharacterized protein BYT42DRAFT_585707 [Radiomyces spectabilis]KAI8368202.1 hypothetical protein BYT42DRAFT_585707 [Radiomyces spectabilis]
MPPSAAEDQHQDPLLNPGQLKQIIKALPGKQKLPHEHYQYRDTETLTVEIDEFFTYTEVATDLQTYRRNFKKQYSQPWDTYSEDERIALIQQLLDRLENAASDDRVETAQHLVYIALGNFGDCIDDSEKHSAFVKENNNRLMSSGTLSILYDTLKRTMGTLNQQTNATSEIVDSLHKEISLYLTIFYVVIETNRQNGMFSDISARLDLMYLQLFFNIMTELKEGRVNTFPVKKLILVLWKVIICTFGGLDQVAALKNNERVKRGLPASSRDTIIGKCTPQDFYAFQARTCEKYPTYSPCDLPATFANPLTIKATPALANAMGIATASAQTELPYQTLFPPKDAKQGNGNEPNNNPRPSMQNSLSQQTLVLPLSSTSPSVPRSIVEASQVYQNHMHLSLANCQIVQERELSIRKWQDRSEQRHISPDKSSSSSPSSSEHQFQRLLDDIESVYAFIVPDMQAIVIVLLKLLLSTVASGKNSARQTSTAKDLPEEVDAIRNREIISKATSAVILLLLKWFKVSHVLKYEYLSQILVDSGCMLLILKILGLQDMTKIVSSQTDLKDHSFFNHIAPKRIGQSDETEHSMKTTSQLPTNGRNMFWIINLLRISQKLCKGKTHRIMLLVQYKSSAIFKRILKISNVTMELYALKNLKNQVPYLGRRWRSVNMKTISAIYLHCYTNLDDDWLSKNDTDDDLEDGKAQEINLRMLIKIYNGQRYLPSMLPQYDEPDSGFSSAEELFTNNADYILQESDLDEGFMRNYEQWLEDEVYSTTTDDDPDQHPGIGTPIPSTPVDYLSPEMLAKEINKLYEEELQKEFPKVEPVVTEETGNGWDQPICLAPKEGDDFDDKKKNRLRHYFGIGDPANEFEDIDADEEDIRPDDDPLNNIDWETLTEEELTRRLTKVEERTTQRWLNIDINDPQYIKVLFDVSDNDGVDPCDMDYEPVTSSTECDLDSTW